MVLTVSIVVPLTLNPNASSYEGRINMPKANTTKIGVAFLILSDIFMSHLPARYHIIKSPDYIQIKKKKVMTQ